MSTSVVSRRDLVRLALAAAAWGGGTVISKRALDETPALTLLPLQLAASLVVLVIMMRRHGMSLRGSPVLLGRLGILNPGLAYALGLLGLTTITASLAVLLWAAEPLMILILAATFLRERITPALVLLSLVAVAGMVLVIYDPATKTRTAPGSTTRRWSASMYREVVGREPEGDRPALTGREVDAPEPRAAPGPAAAEAPSRVR